MKIIDNRKDFYDFTCGMYDTDDSIVYVRKTQCFRHNITDEKKTIDAFKKALKNKIPPTTHKTILNTEPYQFFIEHLVVGIYPNVYIIPFIVTIEYNKNMYAKWSHNKTLPLPIEFYNDDEKILEYYFSKYPDEKNRKYKMHTYGSMRKTIWNENYFVNEFVFENKDVFEKIIKAPTFIFVNDNDNNDSSLREIINRDKSNPTWTKERHNYYTTLIVNPVFVEYPSFILNPIRHILDNTPIYNDIENFLWAIKQEPIAEPNNEIKIVNHGFDLKTSFRKM